MNFNKLSYIHMIIQIKAYMIACAPMSVCHRCHAHVQSLSHVQRFVIPWTGAHQAPLFMEFSRQEYYRLPFPTPGDLPDPGIKPVSCFSCDEEHTHAHTKGSCGSQDQLHSKAIPVKIPASYFMDIFK